MRKPLIFTLLLVTSNVSGSSQQRIRRIGPPWGVGGVQIHRSLARSEKWGKEFGYWPRIDTDGRG